MARRARNRPSSSERDPARIASDLPERFDDLVTRSLPQLPFDNQPAIRSPLAEVEDRRTFHPDGMFRPVRSVGRARAQVRVAPSRARVPTLPFRFPDLHFFNPARHVAICVRRKIRKEVLFATKGRGKGARTPKRRNYWSKVRC